MENILLYINIIIIQFQVTIPPGSPESLPSVVDWQDPHSWSYHPAATSHWNTLAGHLHCHYTSKYEMWSRHHEELLDKHRRFAGFLNYMGEVRVHEATCPAEQNLCETRTHWEKTFMFWLDLERTLSSSLLSLIKHLAPFQLPVPHIIPESSLNS